jgi:ribosomal-protein-alanine N-acetyltransferase
MLKYVQRTPMVDLDQADAFIKRMVKGVGDNASLYWLMEIKSTKQVIGSICLWNFSEDYKTAEIGYAMFQKFHGKGYMSEAFQAVIELGKTALDLENLEAFTHRANNPSTQLLIRNGFSLDLHRRDDGFLNNRIFTRYIKA